MHKRKSHLRMSHSKHYKCILICRHAQTPFQGTGGHLLAFSKALIKGMAEHTEGMGKEWEKTTTVEVWQRHSAVIINSCQCALKRSLDRQIVPNGLCFFPMCLRLFVRSFCCYCVCMHVYISVAVCSPLLSLFRTMHTG